MHWRVECIRGGDPTNNRIRQARVEAGISQAELGEQVGYTTNYINMIENGKRNPSPLLVSKIAEILDVDEQWLRTGEGDMHKQESREQELARYVGQLLVDRPESMRSALITTLLCFDPDGPEWEVLERIMRHCIAEMDKETDKAPGE